MVKENLGKMLLSYLDSTYEKPLTFTVHDIRGEADKKKSCMS